MWNKIKNSCCNNIAGSCNAIAAHTYFIAHEPSPAILYNKYFNLILLPQIFYFFSAHVTTA